MAGRRGPPPLAGHAAELRSQQQRACRVLCVTCVTGGGSCAPGGAAAANLHVVNSTHRIAVAAEKAQARCSNSGRAGERWVRCCWGAVMGVVVLSIRRIAVRSNLIMPLSDPHALLFSLQARKAILGYIARSRSTGFARYCTAPQRGLLSQSSSWHSTSAVHLQTPKLKRT